MLKTIQRITSLLLLLSVLAGISFFILYPHISDIRITANSYQAERIARNTTLQVLTYLSPPNQNAINEELASPKALEHVSSEELFKLQQEGKIKFNMEEYDTHLEIPSVAIKGGVVDGPDANEMDRGFWHFTLSSQPGNRGNTVIIAHRFLHLPPRTDTFFSLDKVKVGDKIVVTQKNGTYRYTVLQTKVVEKTDTSVLAQTGDYRLTLITCTPLWTADQRLIVVAKLDKVYGNI